MLIARKVDVTGLVACTREVNNACRILVGKCEGKITIWKNWE
jgi:hypothetical protein